MGEPAKTTVPMRILSGVQPSGRPHIGNYFGAMRQNIELSHRSDAFIFIANYHAMTTVRDRKLLAEYTDGLARDYLALGLDPSRCAFYRQSDVPEVCELSWILTTVTPMGLLERCVSYKDKVDKGIPADHGLFAYPVLMAADILIVKSTTVPVGADQKQHVEVARDIAIKFNNTHGNVFPLPEERILPEVAAVPGVDGQKMSKSYGNTIEPFEDEKALRRKVMSIKTDSKGVAEVKDPETCNLFALFKLFAKSEERDALAARYRSGGLGYGDVKKRLADLILEHFAEARKRRAALTAEEVEAALRVGAEKARKVARETMVEVRKAVGV
ncbi:MAG: tryptophanyl-tRNA [Planctomycetota bacterium]|nr:MAG: tryptophanyl-tRNA [Planctomycetota bacterium]